MAGSRTLLIDADLRNPTLTAQLGVVRPDGLAELLAGVPDLAPAATAIPNLELMPAGQIPANPGELLNSHCLGEWLAHVRPSYDLIVLDAPSLSACSDSLLLADHADAILVTVRPGMTERQALVRAWEQLAPIQAKVLGCVPIQGA